MRTAGFLLAMLAAAVLFAAQAQAQDARIVIVPEGGLRAMKIAEANEARAEANALNRNLADIPSPERAYLILPEGLGIEGLSGAIAVLPAGKHNFNFRGRDIAIGGGGGAAVPIGGGVSVGVSLPGTSIENSVAGEGTVESGKYYRAEIDATRIGDILTSAAIVELTGEELAEAEARVAEWLSLSAPAEIGGVTWAGTNVGEPGRFVPTAEDHGNYYTFDDAQTACPDGWRTPTREEFKALIDAGRERTEIAGVSGRMFGGGDARVFFPGGGGVVNTAGVYNQNAAGFYWSSTPKNKRSAYGLSFNAATNLIFNNAGMGMGRANGMTVRCVK
ncbi:MAG: fibrobacter succinogenes major paralogous domain-containing protein [Alistipes sp.]|jgi:uncharacterized protein (TIGR02145 family)|nr:fibrobacter succinogenes major paralogous domain-containing protein [Alistipes sp.]